jgi:hypothetical protein
MPYFSIFNRYTPDFIHIIQNFLGRDKLQPFLSDETCVLQTIRYRRQ